MLSQPDVVAELIAESVVVALGSGELGSQRHTFFAI